MIVVMGIGRALSIGTVTRTGNHRSCQFGGFPAAPDKIAAGEFPPLMPQKRSSKTEGHPRSKSTGKILRSEVIYKGPIFGVRRDEVLEPTGVRATREVITHPGSVVVMPVLPDGRIILIRQYRHAARQFLWELVAGRMDPGESIRQAAARELIEETGYRAKRLRVFLDLFPTPGFLEERMYILIAEAITAGSAEPEEDEKIVAKAFTRAELEKMIQRGVLRDAKSVAGLLYYFNFLA
jgi:ADP-ribose pyrophosphatase